MFTFMKLQKYPLCCIHIQMYDYSLYVCCYVINLKKSNYFKQKFTVVFIMDEGYILWLHF